MPAAQIKINSPVTRARGQARRDKNGAARGERECGAAKAQLVGERAAERRCGAGRQRLAVDHHGEQRLESNTVGRGERVKSV